jgi:hypothetical protein
MLEEDEIPQNEYNLFSKTQDEIQRKTILLRDEIQDLITTNQTAVFLSRFPEFIVFFHTIVANDLSRGLPIDYTKQRKSNFHKTASLNNNQVILGELIKQDFVPDNYDFRYRIFSCDTTPFSFFTNVLDDFTILLMEEIVSTCLEVSHLEKNRKFLCRFLGLPAVKKNFNFRSQVASTSFFGPENWLINIKIFVEIGDHVDLGQVVIDNICHENKSRITQNIDDLVFLISHGGKRIDRIIDKNSRLEIFFQLLIRKIEFETKKSKQVEAMKRFISGLEEVLLDIFPKDLIPIILLGF